MRRPHMSTGAWIFASVIAASVIAPTAVYAAATSTVAIGNTANSTTASVTTQHQLLTAAIAPNNVVHAFATTGNFGCATAYTPPAGKAIVVASVTYDMWGNTAGQENVAYLNPGCTANVYDIVDTSLSVETETRTFPLGLPMPSVSITSNGPANVNMTITGYLIPASQLPAALPHQGMMPAHRSAGHP